jgi:metal-sulfur cluster biosynthetic enzyme
VIKMVATKDSVIASIYQVEDPELKISLVELGLIYDVRLEEGEEGVHAEVDLTLTSPGCPVAPEIMASVHRAALTTDGVESVHINLVWTPRWDPKVHASEDALMDMGIF